MTKEEFHKQWTLYYPNTVPISYLFKTDLSTRWFRIHSLPDSKRYAENEEEWNILLKRQNEIITNLLEVDTTIFIVTGKYTPEEHTAHLVNEEESLQSYDFLILDDIDLHRVYPEDYDDGQFASIFRVI